MKKIYSLFSSERKKKCLSAAVGTCIVLFAASTSIVNAQVQAYNFSQSSGNFTPITGTVLDTATGNVSASNLNSVVHPVALPFGFNFNGTMYNSINVSSNGFITFGATTPSTTNTTPISNTAAYDGAVSAFGRDLNSVFDVNGVTGNISWTVEGVAPNREVVIQWKDFRPTNVTSTTSVYTFSFQVRLAETTNVIKTVYSSGSYVIGSTSYSSTAQIGLRGATNTDFNNRLNATTLEFVNSTPGTANNSTQAFNTVNAVPGMPTNGLTYTWTPPTCYMPTGLSVGATTMDSAQISWTAPSSGPAPSGYDIYYSSNATPPTATTVPQISNFNGTSTTINSLLPSTNYNVWVRTACSSTDKSNWTSAVSFATLCTDFTGAYSENFDSYTVGSNTTTTYLLPNCWTNMGTSNGAFMVSGTAQYVVSGNSVYMWPTTGRVSFVALPPMTTLQSGLYRFKFDVRAAVNAGATILIGYLDATNNFVQLDSYTVAVAQTNYTYSLDLPVLPAGVNRLAIKHSANNTNSVSIDNVVYELKSLSTMETDNDTTVKVYPNPFVDVLNISNVDDVKSIQIVDLAGRVVKNFDSVSSILYLDDLRSGVYILHLNLKNGKKVSEKVIRK